ncbi:MAG: response regulator [Spirochaetaceae bacterium]|jgi:two-component system response regulator YesN|nr:response regulator [Spirochaetaceae bacterium]
MKTEKRASIFLVDDEQPVLDGLSVTIEKVFPDLKICGAARSGMDALKGIAREKPDLVVMDVRMPGMSGIDTLRELRRILPDMIVILLTAYERFDIAQEAYSLGVYKYLVKPVSREILTETITGALERLEKTKAGVFKEASERERFEITRPLLEAGFIWAAIMGDPQSFLLQSFGELLGLVKDGRILGHFAVICREKYWLSQEELTNIRREITNRLECISGPLLGGLLPIFIPGEKLNRTRDVLRNVLETLQMREFRYALGYVASGDDIRFSWTQALSGMRQEGPGSPDRILGRPEAPPEDPEERAAPRPGEKTPARADLLLQFLNDRNMLKLRHTFLDWSLAGAAKIDRAVMAGALTALAGADAEKILTAGNLQMAVDGGPKNRTAAEYAANMLCAGLSTLPASQTGEVVDSLPGGDRRIRRALQFIAQHYGEPISLEDAAAHVRISPAHLSRLFPVETGNTFSGHLAHLRINRACEALEEGILSIKEIAALCGYQDANYFSRAFKKILGLSPSQWVEEKTKRKARKDPPSRGGGGGDMNPVLTSHSQNSVRFGKGFGKSGQRSAFPSKSKAAFLKTGVLGKP